MLTDSLSYQCFAMPSITPKLDGHWYFKWRANFQSELGSLNDADTEQLVSLVLMLLCGEQSAVITFNKHAKVMSEKKLEKSRLLFSEIESDEYMHERALQGLLDSLPKADDLHRLKRQSQQFYISLSKQITISEQFARISQLDSCVCSIMHAMSRSRLAKLAGMAYLFTRIKQDEARHVSISRKHAVNLGLTKCEMRRQSAFVRTRLVEFLEPMADRFDRIEIDPEFLFKQIAGKHL